MVSIGPYEYEDTNVTSNFRKRTAQARIEALEAENKRLREALEEIADPFDESSLQDGPSIARRALEADDGNG